MTYYGKGLYNNRSSEHFKAILKACTRFSNLAPYSAMLVEMQRLGLMYVLTKDQWDNRYNRVLNPNARHLIILVPFGPVEFVFEIGDAMRSERNGTLVGPSAEDIPNEIVEPNKIKQNVPLKALDNLIRNLVFQGIDTAFGMATGAVFGAQIRVLFVNRKDITIP